MGYLRVKISGLNLSRLIDKLVLKGILLNDLRVKSNSIVFLIKETDLLILKNVCKQERKFYEILYASGWKNLINKFKYLLGVVIAVIVTFCYLFSYGQFLFKINITSNDVGGYDVSKVLSFLNKKGVVVGTKKSDYLAKDIEMFLLENFDDLSGCTVRYDGGDLNICVYPAIIENKPLEKKIVSKFDAVITKIETFAGESVVELNQVVKKGDNLIVGENGASGIVEGKIYFVGTEIYNEVNQVKEKTGNYQKIRNYKLFNKYLCKSEKMIKFPLYLIEKCDFYITDKYFLPIMCEEFIVYETVLKEKIVPFKDVEKEIMKKAYNSAIKQIENIDDISNITYSIVNEGDYTRVDCYVEAVVSLI